MPGNHNTKRSKLEETLTSEMPSIPEEVTSWLGRLVLLYGVPFNYLIPEEKMLPGESRGSLRFFLVDPIWMQCLVQGACSVGSNGYGDRIIDTAMNEWAQPNQPDGKTQASLANKQAAGVRDRLREQYEAVPLPQQESWLNWPLTGFLLRSAVVAGWRGLEVMAYRSLSPEERKTFNVSGLTKEQNAKLAKDGVAPLKALRIEQLSTDVMIGLFNGTIAELIIRQPQEGLHFGLTKEAQSYTKKLRDLGYNTTTSAGQLLPTKLDLATENLLRDQDCKGVVKIADFASKMQSLLSGQGQLRDGKFTSAEFAVEMIEAAGEFTFLTTIKTAP
jgi:hypothetical protein